MIVWGKQLALLEQKGRTFPAIDSMIAATAISHELILVTRNINGLNRPTLRYSILGNKDKYFRTLWIN
jgi:predicted nucleic acid-binding protein